VAEHTIAPRVAAGKSLEASKLLGFTPSSPAFIPLAQKVIHQPVEIAALALFDERNLYLVVKIPVEVDRRRVARFGQRVLAGQFAQRAEILVATAITPPL
jgi:hypothetical protein